MYLCSVYSCVSYHVCLHLRYLVCIICVSVFPLYLRIIYISVFTLYLCIISNVCIGSISMYVYVYFLYLCIICVSVFPLYLCIISLYLHSTYYSTLVNNVYRYVYTYVNF